MLSLSSVTAGSGKNNCPADKCSGMKHWDEKRKPSQIVVEELLGNISNILNCLLTLNPNLVESDEHERHIIVCRAAAKDAGIQEGNRDMIYEFVVNRVRLAVNLLVLNFLIPGSCHF